MTGKLTKKQQAYVDARLGGATQSDAFRQSYNCKNLTEKSIWQSASRIERHVKVKSRLDELQAAAVEKVVLNKAWVIERLMKNAAVALAETTQKLTLKVPNTTETTDVEMHRPDPSAANRALELLGKELNMFVDKSEVDLTGDLNVNVFDTVMTSLNGATRGLPNGVPVKLNGKAAN